MLHLVRNIQYNQSLSENFSYKFETGLSTQYKEGVPVDEMNLKVFTYSIAYALPDGGESVLSLPLDLTYYDRDHSPVMTLEKGTEVYFYKHDLDDAGYGIESFPTYEAGWRYARPFIKVEDGLGSATDAAYYVKLNDLRMIARDYIRQNQNAQVTMNETGKSLEEMVEIMTTMIDHKLYSEGVYLSPDLVHTIWGTKETAMAIVAVIIAVISFLPGSKK